MSHNPRPRKPIGLGQRIVAPSEDEENAMLDLLVSLADSLRQEDKAENSI